MFCGIGLLPGVGGTRVSGMILSLTAPCLRGTSAATMRRMHLRMRAIASGRRALSNEGPCCEIGGGHSFGPSALRPGAQKSEPDCGRFRALNSRHFLQVRKHPCSRVLHLQAKLAHPRRISATSSRSANKLKGVVITPLNCVFSKC